ncbi:MAG: hypothetical protein WB809_08080 [Thermoplasmata archaeon]
MPTKKKKAAPGSVRGPSRKGGFVGRDASPVLDKYPAKDPSLSPRGPPRVIESPAPAAPAVPVGSPLAASPATPAAPIPLITLERPFDVDEFSGMLGETSLRVTVPREDLPEVLRRVVEFMGFGIYVYSVSIRPAASDLLKSFVVELRRVDFSSKQGDWVPFVEKGASDSPFGPSGTRT